MKAPPKNPPKNSVSKSKFKPRALEYFRQVQASGKELIITEHGKPVLKLVPFSSNPDETLRKLRGSVIRYRKPTEPVGLEDWESLR